jgi:hypothetical protein
MVKLVDYLDDVGWDGLMGRWVQSVKLYLFPQDCCMNCAFMGFKRGHAGNGVRLMYYCSRFKTVLVLHNIGRCCGSYRRSDSW